MKIAASLLAALTVAALAQEDGTRQLWNTEFLKKRPAADTSARPAPQPTYKPIPQAVKSTAPASPVGSGTMLGLTLWRLRDPKPSETRVFVLKSKDESRERTQERIDVAAPITQTDGYRFTFEMPANGYLYVIDRERYADGKMSDPYLIYPNAAGDNVVVPGRLIEVPDRREIPNYFTIAAKAGQTAEVLSFLVTPEPIPGLRFSHDPVSLDPALYASLEKKAATKAERYELEGGAGKTITESENKAGTDRQNKVTQSDPMPQTLYRINAKPGSPVMIEIPLEFKR
jgi:hypothetical protein